MFTSEGTQAPKSQPKLTLHLVLSRVKNKRELHASLQGKTLGDADGGADSALQWIKRAKKKEKELARKRAQEYESMDKVTEVDSYTESAFASPPTRAYGSLVNRGPCWSEG